MEHSSILFVCIVVSAQKGFAHAAEGHVISFARHFLQIEIKLAVKLALWLSIGVSNDGEHI